MTKEQVQAIVSKAEDFSLLEYITVQTTASTIFSNSESSALYFDNSKEYVVVIRTNASSVRNLRGENPIEIVFVDYGDISSISFDAAIKDVKEKASTLGTFNEIILKNILTVAGLEHQASGFSAAKPKNINLADATSTEKLQDIIKSQNDPTIMKPWEVANVPTIS